MSPSLELTRRAGSPMLFASGNPPDQGSPYDKTSREAALPGQRRVLIVEDEAVVAMNIDSALAEAGFEILDIVDTEQGAIDAARRLNPDIVLMDITLREGNGISAAKRIQQQQNAKIIFLSGNSDPRTLADAHAIKAAGFILKPFVTERLAKLVLAAMTG